MLEDFILNTLWVLDLFLIYGWFFNVVWVFISISTVVLFIYHLHSYYELDFFLDNIDVLGEFSMASYKTFLVLFAVIPLFGSFTIIWSVAEGLDSRKFLARFGCP